MLLQTHVNMNAFPEANQANRLDLIGWECKILVLLNLFSIFFSFFLGSAVSDIATFN